MASQGTLELPAALRAFRAWQSKQQRGARVPEYWRDVLDRDHTGGLAIMVVEVVFGASRFRLATVPFGSVSGTDGMDHSVQLQLVGEPEIRHGYDLGEGTSQARSVQVTLGAEVINPAALIRSGQVLSGYGEVALEVDKSPADADHDRRYVIIHGEIAGGVRFGGVRGRGEHEIIDLEIVDPKASMDVRFPLWVVDDSRFSTTLHDTAIGQRIPVVLNGYDRIPAVRIDDVSGARQFAFAHRHGWDTANAIVEVNGTAYGTADATYGHAFVELYDDEGVPYTVVSFTVGATSWADGDAVHVTVDHNDEELSVIGVIRRVCELHTPLGPGGLSGVLFSEADAKLGNTTRPRVLANGASGGSESGALQWIEEGYLSNFPMVSMVWDLGGYGPIVTDRRADPVASLVAGQGPLLDRRSLVQETPKEELFNEWVIRYDYDPALDTFKRAAVRSPLNNAVCAASRDLLGERHASVIEAHYIKDDELAEMVLNWLVEHRTLPSYFLEYDAFGSVFWELRRGDTILLTDSDFDWNEERTTVEEITYRRGRVVLGLRVWLQFVKLGGAAQNAPLAVQS